MPVTVNEFKLNPLDGSITTEYSDGSVVNGSLLPASTLTADDTARVQSGVLTPLASALRAAARSAAGANPWDLPVTPSPPTITVGATALANGQAINYFDAEGYKRIRIRGVPFGDQALMIENATTLARPRCIANNAGAVTYAQTARGYLAEVGPFTGQIIQFAANGLNAALLRFRVDGALVSATPTTAGNTIIQLDFGAVVYRKTIAMEFEQAQSIKGVIIGPNDTLAAVEDSPLPVLLIADSYGQGITSPQSVGGLTYPAALRDIGGINLLAQGIAGSGYVKTGNVLANDPARVQFAVDAVNQSGAPLVVIALGTNDYTLSAAGITASALDLGNALLSRTAAKVAYIGPWPQTRNGDAASLAVEAAIKAAADALDQARVGFIPVCSGPNPWVKGQGTTTTTPNGTSVAYGNSALVTGPDNVHANPAFGTEYLARKTLDALTALCAAKRW
jgi:hypothetical protein